LAAMGGTAEAVGGGGFLAGAVSAGIAYSYGTMFTSIGNNIAFGDPMPTGEQFLTGLGISMLTGGVLQGINASVHGRNFWDGNLPKPTVPLAPIPSPNPVQVKVDDPVKTPDKINLNSTQNNSVTNNQNLTRIEGDGVKFVKEAVPPRTINGMSDELPIRAAERNFSPEDIIKIVDKGDMTQAMGRYGPQIRYTLGSNTVVVDQYGTIITCFSNAPATNLLPRGYFIPFK